MKRQYVKIITAIALAALLGIQGIWLFNTYNLLHQDLSDKLKEGFARSIEKEVYIRYGNNSGKNRSNIPEGTVVKGASPELDFYTNALYFHEHLLSWDHPLSLERVDSIWSKRLQDEVGDVTYLLMWTDAAGNIMQQINRGANEKSPTAFMIERPIRNDHSEYLRVIIDSPYKIVLRQMLVLLIISLFIVLILAYSMYLQISIIIRQDQIAALRQDFTNTLVHDMRNPISNINIGVHALQSGSIDDNPDLKKQYFELTMKETNRLLAFTNKILTIAKYENTNIGLEKSKIDLKELIDSLIKEYLLSPPKGIAFTADIPDGATIYADTDYIGDVLRNLIDNAIKYSNDPVDIHIKAEKNKHQTIVKIKDNGIGISQQNQKHLFQKFERIQYRDKNRRSGFGLGLYFVHQIITAHGGTITVDSVPDEYSEFTLMIPDKQS